MRKSYHKFLFTLYFPIVKRQNTRVREIAPRNKGRRLIVLSPLQLLRQEVVRGDRNRQVLCYGRVAERDALGDEELNSELLSRTTAQVACSRALFGQLLLTTHPVTQHLDCCCCYRTLSTHCCTTS